MRGAEREAASVWRCVGDPLAYSIISRCVVLRYIALRAVLATPALLGVGRRACTAEDVRFCRSLSVLVLRIAVRARARARAALRKAGGGARRGLWGFCLVCVLAMRREGKRRNLLVRCFWY